MHTTSDTRSAGLVPRHSFAQHAAAVRRRGSGAQWVRSPQANGTMAGYRVSLQSEELEYRLRVDGPARVCERVLTQSDGSQLVQCQPVSAMAELARFIEADVYQSSLRDDFARFLELCTPHVTAVCAPMCVPIEDPEDAQELLCSLSESSSVAEVIARARELVRYAGAENVLFVLATREGSLTSFEYLVGCNPAWVQTYVSRRWHAVDPFAIGASRATECMVGGDLELRSRGQLDLRAAADRLGFASAMAIPCRLSSHLYGYLLVGSDAPAFLGEPRLRQHRALLRVLALELFDWVRKRAYGGITLSDDDRQLLQYVDQGLESREVAALLHTTEGMVNKRYCRINKQLGVTHKSHALQAALDLGLLHPVFSAAA